MKKAVVFMDRLKDFTKAEEMYRVALDGSEKSLGKDRKDTKQYAENLAILLCWKLEAKEKTRALIKEYPALLQDGGDLEKRFQDYLRDFIK